jgi:stearoyl-CoA desaturase (Delta-9 desaturase)
MIYDILPLYRTGLPFAEVFFLAGAHYHKGKGKMAESAQILAMKKPPRYGTLNHRIAMWILLLVPFVVFFIWVKLYFGAFGLIMVVALHLIRGFGVTVGNHRLLTHNSFKCKPWVRSALMIMAGAAVQGEHRVWIAVHRIHHKFSDKEGDPHSPHVDPVGEPWKSAWAGAKHAHYWWFTHEYPSEQLNANVKRELADPQFVWYNDRWKLWAALSFVIPALIGAVYFRLVGGTIHEGILQGLAASGTSLFFVGHSTFMINSVCHLWGDQPFENDDEARDVWWLTWFTLGESYHHRHHVWEWMAFHGMSIWNDPSAMFIKTLIIFKQAWSPRMPTQAQIDAKRRKQMAPA